MLRRLTDWLRGGRKNRPGGMAWIRDMHGAPGAEVLNGRAVCTVRDQGDGFWEIEPEQAFVATGPFRYRDRIVPPGERVTITAIVDDCLVPWKDDGVTKKEVRELFAPDRKVARPAKVEPTESWTA